MMLVAATSLFLGAGIHRGGGRPGFYFRAFGRSAGVCRNDAAGYTLIARGGGLASAWDAGIWQDDQCWLEWGLRWQNGQLRAAVGYRQSLL
jgi:hypothetical protein